MCAAAPAPQAAGAGNRGAILLTTEGNVDFLHNTKIYVCFTHHWNMYILSTTEICIFYSPLEYVYFIHHWNMYILSTTGICMFYPPLEYVYFIHHWNMYIKVQVSLDNFWILAILPTNNFQ